MPPLHEREEHVLECCDSVLQRDGIFILGSVLPPGRKVGRDTDDRLACPVFRKIENDLVKTVHRLTRLSIR